MFDSDEATSPGKCSKHVRVAEHGSITNGQLCKYEWGFPCLEMSSFSSETIHFGVRPP